MSVICELIFKSMFPLLLQFNCEANSIESYSDNKSNSVKEEQHLQREARKALNFSGEKPPTPILDTINYPSHMKNLSIPVRKKYLEFNHTWLSLFS